MILQSLTPPKYKLRTTASRSENNQSARRWAFRGNELDNRHGWPELGFLRGNVGPFKDCTMWKIATSIGTIGLSLSLLAGPVLTKTIAGNRLAPGPVHVHGNTTRGQGWHKEGTHHSHAGVHRVGTSRVGRSPILLHSHVHHPQRFNKRSHRSQLHAHRPHRMSERINRGQIHPQRPQRMGKGLHHAQIHAQGVHRPIAPSPKLPAKEHRHKGK